MSYAESSLEQVKKLREKKDFLILAIESSCDETAAAVVRGREVLSNVISSQIEIHKRFGGVVPEIASRNHCLQIDSIVGEALDGAGITLSDVDCFAVTYGAGLLGALLVGVSYAKALSYAEGKPLVAVNHIKGHIVANYISNPELVPPYLALVVSGGHTEILYVKNDTEFEVMGETLDDAAGEAFDKVARVLGLPYPGGPEIEKIAKNGNPNLKIAKPYRDKLNFSYSGLKTAVINYVRNREARGESFEKADVAASFQRLATEMLVENVIKAAKFKKTNVISLAGGVGANGYLRETLKKEAEKKNIKVYLPEKKLCTDNAAMIGVRAYAEIMAGAEPAPLDLDADPSL